MERREIVRRAIELEAPPRLPFFVGSAWKDQMSKEFSDFPNDVCDCWEMDRQKAGWYFDNPADDDWGCGWHTTAVKNMGQVVHHPLADWSSLSTYKPPNPRDPFYFERVEDGIDKAEDRYTVITSHFNLIERLEMLHGFEQTLADFYLEPEKIHRVLDLILEFKLDHINEAGKRFGDRVQGIFLTDDWGTQQNTYVAPKVFEEFFRDRYRQLFDEVHRQGWHVILHSCGRINEFVPYFIDLGVDVLNMQQPRTYGIEELGTRFAGEVCFLTTVDIQATLPSGEPEAVRQEARELVHHWGTSKGGLIVFNYGESEAIGTTDEITRTMFAEFYALREYWSKAQG